MVPPRPAAPGSAPRAVSEGPPRTIIADAVVPPPELLSGGRANASPAGSGPSPSSRSGPGPSPSSRSKPGSRSSRSAASAPGSLQIPVSRGARYARIGALLALDAVLIAFGVVFLLSYLEAREAAANASTETPATTSNADGEARAQQRRLEAAVSALVDEHRTDIQRCYGMAASDRPAGSVLAGRLDIAMTIDADGALTDAQAKVNETGSDELAACVAKLFQGWSVSQPPEQPPVRLTWPLRFEAPEKAPSSSDP